MNVFLGDIAYVLEIALIGAGFVVLYYALKEGSKLMKAGAYIMLIGGILGLLCTSFFSIKFWLNGYFDHPSSVAVHIIKHDAELENTHHFFPE